MGYDEVLRSCESSLRRLKMDYLDLYLIHWPKEGINLQKTFQALNRLVGEGKVRHLGVSNFDLSLLTQSVRLSETPLFTNQVPYSITDRTYDKNGVLGYCQKNGILLTAYSPVRHQNDKGNSIVQQIAATRGVTSHQIALAWLTTQPRVITIPVSFNPQHQDENLKSADIIITETEMEQIG